jgi:sporulation protein YlmC with PRC-barrel domain
MREIDLGLGILDHQLVDCDGRRCGKVDDLELEGIGGASPHVREILVGPRALGSRGCSGRIVAALARSRIVHVPWADVAEVDSAVRLRRAASELRLGRGDERAQAWMERIPGARP